MERGAGVTLVLESLSACCGFQQTGRNLARAVLSATHILRAPPEQEKTPVHGLWRVFRAGVKVALSGVGGDEIFGGYWSRHGPDR